MSIFEKFKDKMSIGGINIELNELNDINNVIAGSFTLRTEKPQEVEKMIVQLIEKRTVWHGKKRQTRTRIRGEKSITIDFSIAPEDEKLFHFNLPYKTGPSWRNLRGGEITIGDKKTDIIDAVGNIVAVVTNERIDHQVKVTIKVKDVWRSPSKSQRIILLDQ